MSFKHCEPAATIINRFGGTSVVAKIVEKDESRVRRWRLPSRSGGTDGLVRDDHDKLALMRAARQRRIRLRWHDFKPVTCK